MYETWENKKKKKERKSYERVCHRLLRDDDYRNFIPSDVVLSDRIPKSIDPKDFKGLLLYLF
ncbi:MAG: hypothetical protein Ct9H300mP20_21220 [Gammaproteobacteria bacterium]|nr:MAG: hypothetical protein Ct9H300mP20_21220 [Gammaproteobacteria bacterium]